MGAVYVEDAEHYGGSSAGAYFKLKKDGDTAFVRLLGNDMQDFPAYACHEVKVGRDETRKLINCLRAYNEPKDKCPLCADGNKVIVKMYIPLFNLDTEQVQMWERGKSMLKKLSGYCARHKDVVQYKTEIERNGKEGDTNTTYELYDDGNGPDKSIHLEDFDIPETLGKYILDLSEEDMEYLVETGELPGEPEEEVTPRRGSRSEGRSARGGRRSRRSDEEEY